ncbi:isoprenylcysteine carboxylmethyltransferase family protein [Alloacidobacterium dinghuense]|uniref:Isoprenylcysteine carboxylmethyltransferase family protein n=1 Tax=Alloacidobacterium dinghuense TaxID=2763107 RepID=A0A7G8BJD6_9BACT|nr:isoprenylcysteine carboxylmethyltransferase family protein [Alloacidobacterium dinghuense]QNI32656.1 isoprenylcysteine carboxylmethyltransferase family protein [Alloacidobacterium dinghuense]
MISTLWTWLYWMWVASEVVIAAVTRTRRSSGNVRDRGSMLLLWIVIVASITACEWIRYTIPATMFGRAHWLQAAALIALMAGLAIRWTAIFTLGKSFSANVAIRESQKVHRTGLYRFVRHPSYLGLLLVFLAVGLHARNWISLVLAVVPTTLALFYRIHIEETALREAFGEEYVAYSRETKRLLPGVF